MEDEFEYLYEDELEALRDLEEEEEERDSQCAGSFKLST